MTNVVPFDPPNPLTTRSNGSLSKTLQVALEAPQVSVMGEAGFELRPGPWKPPAVVPEPLRREAVHAMGALKAASAPVDQQRAEQWVAHLANRCAGKEMPPATKLAGAVSGIIANGYPIALFDDAAVFERVSRKFKFWPGWSELAEVLDDERNRLRQQWERLAVVAKGGGQAMIGRREPESDPIPEGPRTLSPEVEAMLAKAKADLTTAKPATFARTSAKPWERRA